MTSCTAGNCLQSLGGATVVLQEAGNQSPFLWPGVFVATMYVVVYFLIVFLVFNRMVHSCIVPGCNNRSNKEVCKGIKFYVLPFKDEKLLERWLTLACRRREDVTVHSRICIFFMVIKRTIRTFHKYFHGRNTHLRQHIYPLIKLKTT